MLAARLALPFFTRQVDAVILGVDGIPDFNARHSRKHDDEGQLYAFDILALAYRKHGTLIYAPLLTVQWNEVRRNTSFMHLKSKNQALGPMRPKMTSCVIWSAQDTNRR